MSEQKNMWGGRFSASPDEFMVEFGASIDVDIALLDMDIRGSIAWARALAKIGVFDDDELRRVVDGLHAVHASISEELAAATFVFDRSLEDVHMTVESRLTEVIGDLGGKLHTGRSRNDQVALDERMYVLEAADTVLGAIRDVQREILQLAGGHVDTVVPVYTHLQQALPVRLAHYLMAWFWMLERDHQRFVDAAIRTDSMPLGSGAAAGSAFEVDREFLAGELGFTDITENSIDAVSDRDFMLETLSAGAILMTHLSRVAEDLIVWSSREFGYVTVSDMFSTGSSMMPQKKNPDSLELVRGKTGRVFGNLTALLTVMKGLPFSYCKDMQEDKEPLFDTFVTVTGCLRILQGVLAEIHVDRERCGALLDSGMFATDVADYLTRKGLPFRRAHEVVGSLVKWAEENGTGLGDVPLEVMQEKSTLFDEDVHELFDFRASADKRSLPGGTGKSALAEQLRKAHKILEGGETI